MLRSSGVLVQIDALLLPPLLPELEELLLHALFHLVGKDDDVLDVKSAERGPVALVAPDGHTCVLTFRSRGLRRLPALMDAVAKAMQDTCGWSFTILTGGRGLAGNVQTARYAAI